MDDDIEYLAKELNKLASHTGQIRKRKKLSSSTSDSKTKVSIETMVREKEAIPEVLEDKFRCGGCGGTFSELFRRCPHCGIEFEEKK
jgi:rubrerythrin